jgi:hypothetical protein
MTKSKTKRGAKQMQADTFLQRLTKSAAPMPVKSFRCPYDLAEFIESMKKQTGTDDSAVIVQSLYRVKAEIEKEMQPA